VFLLEDLIPQARWTRAALRADDTQVDKPQPPVELARRTPQRRGRLPARTRAEPHVPAVVPTASPVSDKEQLRLAVLLLDQRAAAGIAALCERRLAASPTGVEPFRERRSSATAGRSRCAGSPRANHSSGTRAHPPPRSSISLASSHRRARAESGSTGSTRRSS